MSMAHDQNPTSLLAGKKVILAGAGIGGLSFIIALYRQYQSNESSPPFDLVVYERDSKKLSVEREGYSLTIRGDSGGTKALDDLGLLDTLEESYKEHRWTTLGGFCLWDKSWNQLIRFATKKDAPRQKQHMRIPRNLLRQTMVDAVPKTQQIHWQHACQSAERLENGRIRVSLQDGSTDECDVLVVADGASSRIRTCFRPHDDLEFAGPAQIAGTARFTQEIPNPVNKDWGLVLGGGGTGLFVSPIDEKSAIWSVSYVAETPPEQWKQPLEEEQIDFLIKQALELGTEFEEPFQTLVHASDRPTVRRLNAFDKKPFSHTAHPDIIFIGDCNHAMSPFAGNGANMALIDGVDLAYALSTCNSITSAADTYDKRSVPRSTRAINDSHWSISLAHATGWKLWLYQFFLSNLRLIVD